MWFPESPWAPHNKLLAQPSRDRIVGSHDQQLHQKGILSGWGPWVGPVEIHFLAVVEELTRLSDGFIAVDTCQNDQLYPLNMFSLTYVNYAPISC